MNNIEVFKDIKESSKIELKKILKERQLARKEILFNERDIVDNCIYGGCINKEFVEEIGKEEVLPIFEYLIPDILRREMI